MSEKAPDDWTPIGEITDWRIGGQADRPYDNDEQKRADIAWLIGDGEEKADDSDLPPEDTAEGAASDPTS
jgi:hypothetical protein